MFEKNRSLLRFRTLCPVLAFCLAACVLLSGCVTNLFHPSADPGAESDVSDVSDVPSVPPEPTPDEAVAGAQAKLRTALLGWAEESPAGRMSEWKDSNTIDLELDCQSFSFYGQPVSIGKNALHIVKDGYNIALNLSGLIGDKPYDLGAVVIGESVIFLSLDKVTDKPIRIDGFDLQQFRNDMRSSVADEQPADLLKEESASADEMISRIKECFRKLKEEIRKMTGSVSFARAGDGEGSAEPDGTTVYTKVWDKDQLAPLFDALREFLEAAGKTAGQLAGDTETDESADETSFPELPLDAPSKAELTVVTAEEGIRSVDFKLYGDEDKCELALSATVSSEKDKTAVKATVSDSNGTLAEFDCSVTPGSEQVRTDLKATLHLEEGNSFSAEASFQWSNLTETTAAYSGEVTVMVKKDGALVGFPIRLDGQINQKGDILSGSVHVGLNVKDTVQADFTVTATVSTTETEVTAPKEWVSINEVRKDPSPYIAKLLEIYPELAGLLGQLGGNESSVDVYMTEGQDTAVYIDRTERMVMISSYVYYKDTGKALELTSPTDPGWKDVIPYKLGSNGTITLLGYTMDIYKTEEYILYYDDAEDALYFELYPSEGYAYIDIMFPLTDEELFSVVLGGTKQYTMTVDWAEDGRSFRFKDGTTFYFVGTNPFQDGTDL